MFEKFKCFAGRIKHDNIRNRLKPDVIGVINIERGIKLLVITAVFDSEVLKYIKLAVLKILACITSEQQY